MELKHKQFIEWGRIGGRLRARRLLKATNRNKVLKEPKKVKPPPKKRGPKPVDFSEDARVLEMKRMYLASHTLASIGAKFGITRERVRQLLGKVGVSAKDGGRRIASEKAKISASAAREAKRVLDENDRCLNHLGCSSDELFMLTAKPLPKGRNWRSRANTLPGQYCCQKRNADLRGIPWGLTFPEWFSVWKESGHINERGVGQGKYVLSRIGDVGPYVIGNIKVIPSVENNSNRADKTSGLPMGVSKGGKKYQAKKMIGGVTYFIGTFDSPEEAHEKYLAFNGKNHFKRRKK